MEPNAQLIYLNPMDSPTVVANRRARAKRHYYKYPELHKRRRQESQKSNSEFVDSFKDRCIKCGNVDKRCLDFHHEADEKKQSVASMRVSGLRKETIAAEIAKCVVMCANCHRIEHWERTHNESR